MKFITFTFILFSALVSFAEIESELVDVNKDTKLSSYIEKMNKKLSDEESEIPIVDEKTEEVAEAKSEDQILLGLTKEKSKASAELSPFNKMILAVVALLAIAGSLLLMIRKLGVKVGHTEIAKNIEILTQKSIGPKKNLMLIRVAGETILLGVTDSNITPIKTLSLLEDELPQFVAPQFSKQLKTKIEQTKITDEIEELDGYSVSRLDDVKNAVKKRFLS